MNILLIGLHADNVDYEKWPELSKDKLEAAFESILSELTAEGYNPMWCLTDRGETAEAAVTGAIQSLNPDIIVIGAGVRTDPDHFLLFEKVINIAHREAPNASIAFNTNPFDTVAAVKRWL